MPPPRALIEPAGQPGYSGVSMAEGRAEVRRHSHPGRGGRASATPKGRQVDPQAQDEVRALARRRAAAPRPSDRAPARNSGPLRTSVRGASGRARRRDEDGADRGLRGGDVLRPFRRGRRGPGRRRRRSRFGSATASPAPWPGPSSSSTRSKARLALGCACCARPAWAAAIARRSPRSATTRSIARRRKRSAMRCKTGAPRRRCPATLHSITT